MKRSSNIAIFASGSGTNARAIIEYFSLMEATKVGLVITNKKTAGVIDIANQFKIPVLVINKDELNHPDFLLEELKKHSINFIVLAGFLQKIPGYLIKVYKNKIINIHPALLPKYGGKGMYGRFVHEAVIHNNEHESGITIHYVTEEYDEGNIIFQKSISLENNETVESLENKIHSLEHQYFPTIINETIKNL